MPLNLSILQTLEPGGFLSGAGSIVEFCVDGSPYYTMTMTSHERGQTLWRVVSVLDPDKTPTEEIRKFASELYYDSFISTEITWLREVPGETREKIVRAIPEEIQNCTRRVGGIGEIHG